MSILSMKTSKFLMAIVSIALCMVCFSCGSDDDPFEQPNEEIKTPVKKRLIKTVTQSPEDKYTNVCNYTYDTKGRLVNIKRTVDTIEKEVITLSYSGNRATLTWVRDWTIEVDTFNCQLQFNDEGYIVSCENKDFTYTATYIDGYLTRGMYYQSLEDEPEHWSEDVLNYKDGLLIDGGGIEFITYTEIPNVGNLCICYDYEYFIPKLASCGLFGKMSKYLPESLGHRSDGVDGFSYTLDSDGYVKELKYVSGRIEGLQISYVYEIVK